MSCRELSWSEYALADIAYRRSQDPTTFAPAVFALHKKQGRRDRFQPSQRRYSREPHYSTGESRGHLATLLTATHRSYLILQWCAYPDAVTEDALYEIESTHRFGAQCSTNDAVLDETTTLRSCHLLEKQGQTGQITNIIDDTVAQREPPSVGAVRLEI